MNVYQFPSDFHINKILLAFCQTEDLVFLNKISGEKTVIRVTRIGFSPNNECVARYALSDLFELPVDMIYLQRSADRNEADFEFLLNNVLNK